MSASAGLALTGVVLLVATIVVAMIGSDTWPAAARDRLVRIGWTLFGASVLSFLAGIWMAVAGR